MAKDIRILVVDDHAIVRSGIIASINSSTDKYHVLEAADGEAAIEVCISQHIDLIILDISMPNIDGFGVILNLKLRRLHIKTLVFTFYTEPMLIFNLLKLGVHGYLSKSAHPNQLLEAIRDVLRGENYYPKEFLKKIPFYVQDSFRPIVKVSKKELEIIELITRGLTSKEIANETGYTRRTVETKKLRIEKRFNAKSCAQVVDLAYRMGIIKI